MLSRSSCIGLFATPWAVVVRLLCPRGFSRQEYWSGLPCPPPGYLSNPGIEPRCPILQGDSLPSAPPGKPQIYKSDLVYGFSDWEVFNYWFNLVSHSSCFDLFFFFFFHDSVLLVCMFLSVFLFFNWWTFEGFFFFSTQILSFIAEHDFVNILFT